MTTFTYEARNELGHLTRGQITAATLDDADQVLCKRNLLVVKMEEQKMQQRRARVRPAATRAQVAWQMAQLSIMVETGIPLSEALDCLARQAMQPRLRALIEQISKAVQEGASLSDAMAEHPRVYSSSLVALIRASELSGTMGKVLHRSAGYLMNDLQALKRLRGALMYPLFMFLACLSVTIFLLTVILPKFVVIFQSRGALLPAPTRMLMAMSHSLVHNWQFWIVGAMGLGLLVMFWLKTERGRRQRDHLVLTVPVLSRVFNSLYQSRTFRTLAVLLESGVPLVEAIDIIKDVAPNAHYRDLWRAVDEEIRHGQQMAGPLMASHFIPESIAQMIDNGDRSGRLGLVFARLASFLEEEYDQAIRTATQFIEPCMILFMGGIIGFVAASLMLPLFQASQLAGK